MARPLLFALFCFLAAQTTLCQRIERYYDYNWMPAKPNSARFYSLLEKTDSGWHFRNYYLHSLLLQMEGLYADSAMQIPSGTFHHYHPSRIIAATGVWRNGKKEGLWVSYYDDGTLQDSIVWNNGRTIAQMSWYHNGYPSDSAHFNPDGSGTEIGWFDDGSPSFAGRYAQEYQKTGKWNYFCREGRTCEQEVYDTHGHLLTQHYFDEKGNPIADSAAIKGRGAEFPGGKRAWGKYLSGSLYLPEQYKMATDDPPIVVIDAYVDETGKITDAEVATPFYPAFDKIALEAVLRSPDWVPAIEHNRPIGTRIRIPITFVP